MGGHRFPAVFLAHSKEPGAIPLRTGNRMGDAGKAAVGLALPEEPIIYDGDLVGGPLPFRAPEQSPSGAAELSAPPVAWLRPREGHAQVIGQARWRRAL